MKLPRLFHKIYANLQGCFWLPCPICDREFGEHEDSAFFMMSHNMSNHWHGIRICHNCKEKVGHLSSIKRLLDMGVRIRLCSDLELKFCETEMDHFTVDTFKIQPMEE